MNFLPIMLALSALIEWGGSGTDEAGTGSVLSEWLDWRNIVSETTSAPDSQGVFAARVALLALRASLPRSTSVPDHVVIVGGDAAVRESEEAAMALAGLPKPVACTATVGDAGVMVVTCGAPRQDGSQEPSYSILRELIIGPLLSLHVSGAMDLLIIGREDSMLVGLQTLEQWLQDYRLPPNLALNARHPRAAERAMGAVYVVTLGLMEAVDVKTALDTLRGLRRPE